MKVISPSPECWHRSDLAAVAHPGTRPGLSTGVAASPPNAFSCRRDGEISDAYEVVGGQGEGEDPVHPGKTAMSQLPDHADRLQPAEDLFDLLPLPLAYLVRRVPRCPAIHGTTLDLARDVRCYVALAQVVHEGGYVVALVGTERDPLSSWNIAEKRERHVPFCGSIRVAHLPANGQSMAVLHDDVTHEVELRFLPALGHQARIRVRRRLVGIVASLLPVEIHGGIPWIIRRLLLVRSILPLEALQAGPGLHQRSVHREVLARQKISARRFGQNLIKEDLVDFTMQQPITVLRERRGIPHAVVQSQAHKPAIKDVEV